MAAVLFLTGETMGDACGSSGRSIRNEFADLGFDFLEVNFALPDAAAKLNKIISETPIQLVYSFVGMCADFEGTMQDGSQRNLWEGMGAPFIGLYGDTPAYYFDRHVLPGRGFASLYAFPEHLDFRRRLPGLRGLLGTLPAAVGDAAARKEIDFSAKERGKLLFLKNGNNPEQLIEIWREALSTSMFLMMTDLAGELAGNLAGHQTNDIDSVVCAYFHAKGINVEELTNLRLFFVCQLDDYCRRLKSTLVVESLLDLPIEVHGFNWDHVDFTKRRAKLVPFADYNASRALMREALGVIDMSPNTTKTPHDRPRRAFGAYTLCLTNEQECFAQAFPDHADFSFRFDGDSIRSKAAEVIANPKRYVEFGANVAERYRAGRDPNETGRFILDVASMLRLEMSQRHPAFQNYFVWPPAAVK